MIENLTPKMRQNQNQATNVIQSSHYIGRKHLSELRQLFSGLWPHLALRRTTSMVNWIMSNPYQVLCRGI